jgi:hypothetical protein
MEFVGLKRLAMSPRRLQFDDRIVTLVRATAAELSSSVDVLNDLAEVGRAKETATVFADVAPDEQVDWTKDLLIRTTIPPASSSAVCVLDTGVTRAHPLLEASLATSDCHSCEPGWGVHDHDGHGTQMAGLALYGDLTPLLMGSDPVQLRHSLESVKILPPIGQNPPELYGAVTAEATSRVEIQALIAGAAFPWRWHQPTSVIADSPRLGLLRWTRWRLAAYLTRPTRGSRTSTQEAILCAGCSS